MVACTSAPPAYIPAAGEASVNGIFQEVVQDYMVELLFIRSKYEAC